MLRVGIYGASGYTGQELMRILARHPGVGIAAVTSRRYKGIAVADVYPAFQGRLDLKFMDAGPEEVAGRADFIFSALPHGTAMEAVPLFIKAGKKVVDLSADYRLRDVSVFEKHYCRHASPELLGKAVYGLPELYRKEIAAAGLVANPGCYPTSVILGLAPALKKGILDPASIIVDSKSGASGAGREPKTGSLFCEVNGGFKAYNVFKHRHTPEMEQELGRISGSEIRISFAPHLLPITRGILSTMYATLRRDMSAADLISLYRAFYRDEKFVRICPEGALPNVSSVRGTNCCDIGFAVDGEQRRVAVCSAIDNLFKGAAGQAVQNMNIMTGLEEDTALDMLALFP